MEGGKLDQMLGGTLRFVPQSALNSITLVELTASVEGKLLILLPFSSQNLSFVHLLPKSSANSSTSLSVRLKRYMSGNSVPKQKVTFLSLFEPRSRVDNFILIQIECLDVVVT